MAKLPATAIAEQDLISPPKRFYFDHFSFDPDFQSLQGNETISLNWEQ